MATRYDEIRLARASRLAGRARSERRSARLRIGDFDDAIRALQSLDDLGSEEENQKAWDEMLKLQGERDALEATLR